MSATAEAFDAAMMSGATFRQRYGERPGASANGAAKALTRAADISPRPVRWQWYPYLPAGQISLIGGRGGGGKGLVCASIAAAVSRGGGWPDGIDSAPAGRVLWRETEDPLAEVIVPRLIAADADLEKIDLATRAEFESLDLRRHVLENDLRLIVLSPMLSFLPKLRNKDDELHVRGVLENLLAQVQETDCAIVGICHTNKKADLDAIERILGSVAFTNFVRSVMLMAPDRDMEGTYRFVHAKHNLSVRGGDLLYRPAHVGQEPRSQYVRLEWSRPASNVDIDAVFDRVRKSARQTADDWLVSYLREHGENPAADVLAAAESAGHSRPAVEKARARNDNIRVERKGFPGKPHWALADQAVDDDHDLF